MFSRRVPHDLTRNRLTAAVVEARAGGRRLIDLTATNPTQAGFAYPPDLLTPLADAAALEYRPEAFGSLDARAAVAADYARQHLDVPVDRIALTASTSEAYALLFKLLADEGDEVLIPRPSYPLFDYLAALDLVATRPYDLDEHDNWRIDFDSVERALTPRTRAVAVVSPNNPTGSYVSASDLDRLAALCAARDLAIVADEVFADYEVEPGAAASAGRAPRVTTALTFALGGLSKSIGLPQVKLGWIAASGPDRLVTPALERLELICDTYLSVSTPVQIAAPALLVRGADVRRQIAARVAANYRALQAAVAEAPTCDLLRTEGGWSAVLHVPTFESEEDLVVRLIATAGVLTHPGYFFDFCRESYLVVSLLTPECDFHEGIDAVLRHFACKAARP
jgi:aspartate/methionine/tyrosine aminotransferase